MKQQSRREFLIASAVGLSSGWLAANRAGILDARVFAAAAAGAHPAPFSFFTPQQAAEIDAVASQILPSDDSPGAHEARCVYFIDRALTTFLRDSQPVYRQGLDELQAKTGELFPHAARFSALGSDQQIQVLQAIEHGDFFRAVRTHTILGMFAPPDHGGNFERAGWNLIGFDGTHAYTPPFGYYDAKDV
jgi:gluconate 2-dehydrogenase gamma chain